jgi:hypothetical protein
MNTPRAGLRAHQNKPVSRPSFFIAASDLEAARSNSWDSYLLYLQDLQTFTNCMGQWDRDSEKAAHPDSLFGSIM